MLTRFLIGVILWSEIKEQGDFNMARRAEFKKLSRGYMEGYDYVGYGYFIEKDNSWGEITYYLFPEEKCRFDEDGYVETYNVGYLAKADTLVEAKEFCRTHRRDK